MLSCLWSCFFRFQNAFLCLCLCCCSTTRLFSSARPLPTPNNEVNFDCAKNVCISWRKRRRKKQKQRKKLWKCKRETGQEKRLWTNWDTFDKRTTNAGWWAAWACWIFSSNTNGFPRLLLSLFWHVCQQRFFPTQHDRVCILALFENLDLGLETHLHLRGKAYVLHLFSALYDQMIGCGFVLNFLR